MLPGGALYAEAPGPGEEDDMRRYQTEGSRRLHQQTVPYLLDGVGSSFHVSSYRDYPVAMTHGKGSKLYDVDGNEYIDYVLGFGPMLLGYCPPAVDRAVAEQLRRGSHFSAPTEDLKRLSQRLVEIIPSAELVAYQNSGTEVVMYALRLARAYTGKYKIVKFEGQYHGWSDEEKVSIDASCVEELGDRENPRKILHTKGQRLSSAEDLIVLPWNDLPALERTLAARGGEIAAVLMEPCMCDSGPILPKPGYLEGVREVTRKYGVLLIFDEVITGFRLALGGAQAYYGVTPDLSTFAKAIASGYPFGAVVGRREVMACGVPASGTFNGNPIGVAAALATIETLSQPGVYAHLEGLAQQLETGFRALARKYHRPLYLRHVGSIFILYFGFTEDVEDFRDWLTQADLASYTRFVAGCEEYGVRFTDRRGREYLSVAHTQEDIQRTLAVADQVLGEMERGER